MSKCKNNSFLQRDGTSQQQRLLKALLPEYVAVDERKMEDLKKFALNYAGEIVYYNSNNAPDGDWHSFFDKELQSDQKTEPHYALFHAFLQLFKIAQDDLNNITRRHLDFYYREVLQIEEKPAVSDQVFIILKLAKHVNQHLIKKGTRLKAGKDDTGKELIYETNKNLVVNKGIIQEIKALYKNGNSRLYISPMANSADGKGGELQTAEKNWRTFGKPKGEWPEMNRQQAEIGFAFASPILFLAEGDREISIRLSLKNSPSLLTTLKKLNLREVFRVSFSGEENWIEPLIEQNEIVSGEDIPPAIVERILDFLNSANSWENIAGVEPQEGPVFDDPAKGYGDKIKGYDIGKTTAKNILNKRSTLGAAGFTNINQVRDVPGVGQDKVDDLVYTFRDPNNSTIIDYTNKEIIITRTITKDQEAIVAYNKHVLLETFNTKWPVVKITLHTNADPYVYEELKKLKLTAAKITVKVREVRELVVQNDHSTLDPGKDFLPFGIRPALGSNFYIGSREIFGKQLDLLKVHLLWHDLPDEDTGFKGHYNEYINNNRDNKTFKVNLYLLDKKSWVDLETDDGAGSNCSLFASPNSTPLESSQDIIVENVADLKSVQRDINLENFDAYDTDLKKGFLKLLLTGTDFGHKDYQPSFTKQVLKGVKDNNPEIPMPNEPYTPQLKEIYVNYHSSVDIDLATAMSAEEFENRIEQFFHVEAFGINEQKTASELSSLNIDMLPQYNDEGTLYIGIEDFVSGQNLSLLFQVAEGSADPDLEPQQLKWSYLSNNQWVEFSKFDILSDSTNGLLTSGIITFDVSKQATDNSTILKDGLHWIKATVTEDSDAVSDLIEIHAQAITATFKENNNDPNHLKEPLEAETISKLKVSDSAVSKIKQPFSSFGGKIREKQNSFYTRVSERLRHKGRAITIWDYERLVLERFSSAYKVKCLNHTKYTGSLSGYSELAPGHVTLVVVSNVLNKNAIDPLRPKTSLITLVNINDYISSINSNGVTLHVKNPLYEEIQIKTNVRFHSGYDSGYYAKLLEDDLKNYLSPWAFKGTSDLVFGGRLHQSIILNHVEERPYVDYITCFEMYHIIKDPVTDSVESKNKVEEAVASTAVSILGSTGQMGVYGDHLINVLETEDCECEDNEILPTATIASADDCPCDENERFEV